MFTFPLPDNEPERLQALYRYRILDTGSEKVFDELTQLAARICQTPTALMTLVDTERQWFKSRVGLDVSETPRDIAFCNCAILSTETLVIPNALEDERFATNSLVTGYPYIRFYAGVPLLTSDGYALGSLCVIDYAPRELTDTQIESLEVLGRQVVAQLELRKHLFEAAERECHERFQQVADSAPIFIWVDDRRQETILLNHYWSQFTGSTVDDSLKKSWKQLIHPEDSPRRAAVYGQAFQTQQPYTLEYRIKYADGKYGWLLETGMPRRLPDGTFDGFTGSCVDISDRKESEARLSQAHHELMRVTQLKDAFLSNVSHELRTPLNSILGMAESLKEEVFGSLNERQIKALTAIERGGFNLLGLIDDILDVATIESGHIELERIPTSVRMLCSSCAEAVELEVFAKQVQLKTILNCEDCTLWVDGQRIHQVLINLLHNAIKFTPEGGRVTLEVDAVPSSASQDEANSPSGAIQISVRDTGIGIAPEHIDTLFQPFTQVDGSFTRQYAGVGLGLYLAKRIVELHGGRIDVSSEAEVGSCFTITLLR
ncbi:MAG: ATP-binding protein [Leptolyngbyaceae bacterium]|nr:ATP-binding protein [Leptolyngbyaceae bacterium]